MMERLIGTKSELFLVLLMVGILLVLFTPIPPGVLDFLLILNFSLGLLILLLAFYIDKPVTFSTFPTLLLIATLFRLSLNVAATRLILGDAYAGEVIDAVGNYVVGGSYVIGLVVFLILIVVQYVVVTNGAQRVAEVAARFTLDSMPGKQMSIDADLNMGIIDEGEAQRRRKDVEREANFYGSMDGASKFVKGDAIAGIVIVIINILGGLTIGMLQKGMDWGEALHTYTLLTVGDGIVTQIPALVVSTATGIIVTRASADAFFGQQLIGQVGLYPKSLVMVVLFLSALLLLPGMPALPILCYMVIGGVLAWVALRQSRNRSDGEVAAAESVPQEETVDLEPIEIRIADSLAPFMESSGNLFRLKIDKLRKQMLQDMGYAFPEVRIRSDIALESSRYEYRIYGARLASSTIHPERKLAISAHRSGEGLQGIATKDPSYGLFALWIEPDQTERARQLGYTVVDPVNVMFTHFSELMKQQAAQLLTLPETEQLLRRVRQAHPTLYDELIPNVMNLTQVRKVLQGLLKEQVSIRNTVYIFQALLEHAPKCAVPEELVERVREALGDAICEPLLDDAGQLAVMTFDPELERNLCSRVQVAEGKAGFLLDPVTTEKLVQGITQRVEVSVRQGSKPVLLCAPPLRRHLRSLLVRLLPHVAVLSIAEIPATIRIRSSGIVSVEGSRLPVLPMDAVAASPGV